ncbi:hypothetical protein T484DRAFT_1802932, partial [Baffinella frigidus]
MPHPKSGSAITFGTGSEPRECAASTRSAITFGTGSELRGCALAQTAITFESAGSVA